jgi:hypothetical protein
MTGRLGPLALVPPALAAAFLAGCVGVASMEGGRFAPAVIAGVEDAGSMIEAAEPGVAASVHGVLPGLIQSIHANGVVWFGYNVATAEAGDLNLYDGGYGKALGVAFGNGEDVERFLEIAWAESKVHERQDTGGVIVGTATHNQFFVGGRRYLLPVTGARSRVAPFIAGGLCYNNMIMSNTGTPPPAAMDLTSAYGLGVYVATGMELYFGAQLALCMDMRASYWNWEGVPVNTGYQNTAGGSVSLAYHF